MCCTDALGLAPLLFVLALTNAPELMDELVDALRHRSPGDPVGPPGAAA